jgi:hypothetical protein
MSESLPQLEARRYQVLERLSVPRDMRRGSISETYRRCGKSDCRCSQPGQVGHGPFYAFTTKVEGKTQTLQLRPGAELDKLQQQVAAYREFRELWEEAVVLSERICQLRPAQGQSPEETLKKKFWRLSRKRSAGR